MTSPFNVLPDSFATEIKAQDITGDLTQRIESIIAHGPLVVFMKGNAQFPQCGFSANTMGILKSFKKPFYTFDILADMDIRQGLKEYSNWPTFPQVYFQGKLLGGNDIMMEMFQSGDLKELLETL